MTKEGIFPEAIKRIAQERAEFFNKYEEKLERGLDVEACSSVGMAFL